MMTQTERSRGGVHVLLVDITAGQRRRCPRCDSWMMVALPGLAVSIDGSEPCHSCVVELLGPTEADAVLTAAGMPACEWCGRAACTSRNYHRKRRRRGY
jgi:hypothetical protein